MKVAFFTPRSVLPLHPRLIPYNNYFLSKGIQPVFINKSSHNNSLWSRINWWSLWFFDLAAIQKCKPEVAAFDLIFVTDLKYLPLVKYCQTMQKIVVYETIDHNVDLRFYLLERKLKIARFFKKPIIHYFRKIEKHLALNFANDVIVNSDSLKHYFEGKAHALYYTSPYEDLNVRNDPSKSLALVYLGVFSHEKGALKIIRISRELNLPLYIFGDIDGDKIQDEITQNPTVTHTSRISPHDLKGELEKLFSVHFFMGFSLIQPAHYSYEVQEANKDIDYLALGVPLIGNDRLPTAEKINAGCGIYFDDPQLNAKLQNLSIRNEWSMNCREYYKAKYCREVFERNIDRILGKYLSG
jgi:glycosyltransferase involved in cell wall biosynthesis